MDISYDIKLDFADVLIVPKRSSLKSRKDVNLARNFHFKSSDVQWSGVPIIAANMDGVGTFAMALELQKHQMLTCLIKYYTKEDWIKAVDNGLDMNYAIISSGISEEDLEKLNDTVSALKAKNTPPKFICLDVANGYTSFFLKQIDNVRKQHPNIVLIAGNVVTPDIAVEMLMRDVDLVKVGIGPGSVCTTRVKAGVGYPQLSAIAECSYSAHSIKGHIIGDGGCTVPGDLSKGFAAGADFLMIGGMLAGHDEGGVTPGPDGLVDFYGMSSKSAMDKYSGGVASYRAAEGKLSQVNYKGKVEHTVNDILGGIRSACTYVGACELKELPRNASFVQVKRTHNSVFGV